MSSAGNLPQDESDESDNENDPTLDEAILRLTPTPKEMTSVVSVHRRRKIVTNDFLGRLLFTAIFLFFVTSRVSFKSLFIFVTSRVSLKHIYFCYKPCFV